MEPGRRAEALVERRGELVAREGRVDGEHDPQDVVAVGIDAVGGGGGRCMGADPTPRSGPAPPGKGSRLLPPSPVPRPVPAPARDPGGLAPQARSSCARKVRNGPRTSESVDWMKCGTSRA